MTLHLVVYLVV